MEKTYTASALLLLISTICTTAYAQEMVTDEQEARTVFEEVDERRKSISTEISTMEMIITDSRGRTRSRTMQTWTQFQDDNRSSLTVFTDPGNVRGTGFLSVREGGNELQKLYLPSVGRIQTISAAERGDRFMGSDFTYEDLGDQDPDDYEFNWLETTDSIYTIRAGKPGSGQYSAIEFEIDRETYAVKSIRYYNENDELIKRLEAENFEQVTENLWSPRKMTMYDLRENRNTAITWTGRNINEPIPDWRFTERGLQRGI
ncbi:MAG: outer membrane lipoprotein-sorting protein [Balneolaceae bacterium]